MCGCVSAKADPADDTGGVKPETAASEEEKVQEAEPSKERDPAGDPLEEEHPPPDFSLEGLLDALAIALYIDGRQAVVLRKWCFALGVPEMFPCVELTVHGDGSVVEITTEVSPEQMLAALPQLLALLPEERPSPPGARNSTEAPGRSRPQLARDPVVAAPPPDDGAVTTGVLPMTVVGDGRPRGKAKAKAKVKAKAKEEDSSKAQQPPSGKVADTRIRWTCLACGEPNADFREECNNCGKPRETPQAASAAQESSSGNARESGNQSKSEAAPERSTGRRPESKAMAPPRQDEPNEPPPAMPPASQAKKADPLPSEDVGDEGATVSPMPKHPGAQRPGKLERPPNGKPKSDPVDTKVAAAQWREALTRVTEELAATRAILWLQLGDLAMPRGMQRRVDVGVRLCAPDGRGANFIVVEPYEDVVLSLADVGVTAESGWIVSDMGCSFFSHGPLVLFTISSVGGNSRCDQLLEKVTPASLTRAVQSLAYSSSLRMAVRAGQHGEGAQLGTRFELREKQNGWDNKDGSEKDLQSLAVDLALGKERVFDAILLERFRQTLASVGANATVTSIECRADDVALVSLSLVSSDTSV